MFFFHLYELSGQKLSNENLEGFVILDICSCFDEWKKLQVIISNVLYIRDRISKFLLNW